MDLESYTAPARQDFDVRPNASQIAAAAKRARATLEADAPPTPRPAATKEQLLLAVAAAVVIVLSLIGMTYQLAGAPKPIATPQPTPRATEPAPAVGPGELRVLSAPPTAAPATPAPTATPQPTEQPTAAPVPAQMAQMAQMAQTGRGLGEQGAEPASEAQLTYLEVVAEQAPHCVRSCDGQPGPSGGDWVAVPTINVVQADVIRLQAPHKVR